MALLTDFMLASKASTSPWLRAVASPFSNKSANCECSAAGLTCCSVACNFQSGRESAVAVTDGLTHCPLASSSPPPSLAFSDWTMPTPSRHSPVVVKLSSGMRCWFHGPANELTNCSWSDHAWLTRLAGLVLGVSDAGRTLALPVSNVCGACGHSTARFKALKLASACGMG